MLKLSLNTTISVTASKALYLVSRNQVEVARDSVLQSRSSYCELKSLALSLLGQETVDQTTRERVTTTYAVDDRVDVVVLALIELLTIIDKSLPAIVCSRKRLTESRNNILEAELLPSCP